jgi:predicted dehydrogenase
MLDRCPDSNLGIAIVGAGKVVNAAHLPAYRKAGLDVRGIYDLHRPAANAAAERFALPRVYESLEELFADERVTIVDVAVPGFAQKEIALAVAAHGKHLLCQKPLAESIEDATAIVEAARSNGVMLAVNLNMRWDPALAAVRTLVTEGFFGQLRLARFEISGHGSWRTDDWLASRSRLIGLYDTIHCFDAIRFLFGEPTRVSATAIAFPTEQPPGERFIAALLEFPDNLRGLIVQDTLNWADDGGWTFRFQGTEGVAKGSSGVYRGYPNPKPSTLQTRSRRDESGWQERSLPGTWLPDGWIGTMRELQNAIRTGRPPHHSGEDHLKTLRLVFDAYASIDAGPSSDRL